LRGITARTGAALFFDEVITGFRAAPGGAQEYFGVRADIATYGKIIGGGLPCAAIAGCSRFLDAFDGGIWRYGDDSGPTAGLTYFAGTMVRHPLAMAAAKAVLTRIQAEGPAFQRDLGERTARAVEAIRTAVTYYGAPLRIPHFSSAFRVEVENAAPWMDLIFYHLRDRGVFIQEDRTWFLTAAHTEADMDLVVEAFRDSLAEMADGGLFEPPTDMDSRRPPVPGARLGTTPEGMPSWYLPDPDRPGHWRLWTQRARTQRARTQRGGPADA
jgi:glutamate-1-semialdehyde aminotransferase